MSDHNAAIALLRSRDLGHAERIDRVLRGGLICDKISRAFACACATKAMVKMDGNWPAVGALTMAKRYLRGTATRAEMDLANRAARRSVAPVDDPAMAAVWASGDDPFIAALLAARADATASGCPSERYRWQCKWLLARLKREAEKA